MMQKPPQVLNDLLYGTIDKSKYFLENIQSCNMMFSFTSMGGKVNLNQMKRTHVFRLHGQNYHMIESLLLPKGSRQKFAQLYIYDTDNEVSNRIQAIM